MLGAGNFVLYFFFVRRSSADPNTRRMQNTGIYHGITRALAGVLMAIWAKFYGWVWEDWALPSSVGPRKIPPPTIYLHLDTLLLYKSYYLSSLAIITTFITLAIEHLRLVLHSSSRSSGQTQQTRFAIAGKSPACTTNRNPDICKTVEAEQGSTRTAPHHDTTNNMLPFPSSLPAPASHRRPASRTPCRLSPSRVRINKRKTRMQGERAGGRTFFLLFSFPALLDGCARRPSTKRRTLRES